MVRFRASKTSLSPAVVLLTVPIRFICGRSSLFVLRWFISYVALILSLFVFHLSFFWCLGKDVLLIVAFPRYLHLYFGILSECLRSK